MVSEPLSTDIAVGDPGSDPTRKGNAALHNETRERVNELALGPEGVLVAREIAEAAAASAKADAERVRDVSGLVTTDDVMTAVTNDRDSKFVAAQSARVADDVQAAVAGLEPSSGFVVTSDPDGCMVIVAEPAPAPVPLTAPTLTGLVGGKNKATATWTAPSPLDPLAPITDYAIHYRTPGASSWTDYAHTPSTALSQEVTGLTNGPTSGTIELQVAAVNAAGVGAWSNTLTVTPGAVNGTVFRDPQDRTAAELSGTMPALGPEAWTGSTGQFKPDGRYLAGQASATGALQSVGVGAHGLIHLEDTLNVDSLAVSGGGWASRVYVKLGAGTTDVAYLGLGCNAAGTVSASFVCLVNNVAITSNLGMPNTAIPATTAAADYSLIIDQTSPTTFVVTLNGVTRTVTLASDPGAPIANASRIALTTNSPRVKHRITDFRVSGYNN